jgi:hypothetical protein
MRKEYGKLVRDTFSIKLKERFPTITKFKLKSSYIFPGDFIFSIPTTAEMILGIVILVPDHQGRDQFTLEIGWSTNGRFPELNRRPSGNVSAERTEFQKDEFICRLSDLRAQPDFWWGRKQANESAWREDVVLDVTDAVERFSQYGIPYLDEFFARKGVARNQP